MPLSFSAAIASLASLGLALGFLPLSARLARRLGLVDAPDGARKFQADPVPLCGGYGLWLATALVVGWLILRGDVFTGALTSLHVLAWLGAGLVVLVGGYLDDRYSLRARHSVIAPLLAALLLVAMGVGFSFVNNPFAGEVMMIAPWVGSVVTFFWLVFFMYVTKLLDGLDGLAGGVSALGISTVAAFALTMRFFQPDVALLSFATLGAVVAFLFFNVPPAKIYLGEGGSLWLGLTLGFLAVAGGSKVAVVALVALLPTVDALLVGARRAWKGKPVFAADRSHLHHLLQRAGMNKLNVLAIYFATSVVLAGVALHAPSMMKVIVLVASASLVAVAILLLDRRVSRL